MIGATTTNRKGLGAYDHRATAPAVAACPAPEFPVMTMRVQIAFKEIIFSALLIGAAVAIVGASISTLVI